MKWAYFIVPDIDERIKNETPASSIVREFIRLKQLNPEIKVLYADQKEENELIKWRLRNV